MKSLISIIVPVFNGEQTIQKCLLSIISQTYKDIEVIVVNDGSTDQTQACVEAIALHDQRVKLISQSNQGVSVARNLGMKVAQGDYIGFVDADDWVTPNFVESLIDVATRHDADVVECGYYIESRTHNSRKSESVLEKVIDKSEDVLKNYLSQTNMKNVVWNKIFKASVLNGIEFKSFALGEDFVFLVQVYNRVERYVSTSHMLYHYVLHEESVTQRAFNIKQLDAVKSAEFVLEQNLAKEHTSLVHMYICEKIYFLYPRTIQLSDTSNREKIQKELKRMFKEHYRLINNQDYMLTNRAYRRKHFRLFNIHPMIVYTLVEIYQCTLRYF